MRQRSKARLMIGFRLLISAILLAITRGSVERPIEVRVALFHPEIVWCALLGGAFADVARISNIGDARGKPD